ncbi:MAG TPA: hypothetical protein VFN26_19975 [Candidatus Acidoferrum sp.]|nr:hypothetical protein [Candidatus Acidoferrum sp.]
MATWELLYNQVVPKPVHYISSIVSYLDILGFQKLVETKTAGELSQTLRVLAESTKPDKVFQSEGIEFTKFSDTVIRSVPEGQDCVRRLLSELRSILYAQMALIPRGIAIRGAVTVGKIVQSWGIVYGPAVVRAYLLESKKGQPPRIVIDPEVVSLMERAVEAEGLQSEWDALVQTEETTTYLDYLRACEMELNVPEQEYPIFVLHHRDLIRDGLKKYSGTPAVLSKYEWMRNYHERTLQRRFANEVPSHLRV